MCSPNLILDLFALYWFFKKSLIRGVNILAYILISMILVAVSTVFSMYFVTSPISLTEHSQITTLFSFFLSLNPLILTKLGLQNNFNVFIFSKLRISKISIF